LQFRRGRITILEDWVREGDPAELLRDVVTEARLETKSYPRVVAGPRHFETYNNVGLTQASRRLSLDIRKGADPGGGREEIRKLLGRSIRGVPALVVAPRARWVVNGFAGGYCRAVDAKTGQLVAYPKENEYKVLMEGIESFAGLLTYARDSLSPDGDEDAKNYATSDDGRRFISALPVRERRER